MENNIEQEVKDFADDKIKPLINMFNKTYTKEYLAQLAKQCYEDDRNYPENFSNWYPYIIDFGEFKHADIISNQIFTFEETQILEKEDNIKDVNWNEIAEILKPTLDKMERSKLYSIKNGCFSNKFNFEDCISTKLDLMEKFWKINYASACLDTGGQTEIVVRELIPHTNNKERMTIYNGMPLRNEIRVFYNMEKEQIEYIVDYWDYDYCKDHLTNVSDKIIFDYFHGKIGNNQDHNEFMGYVAEPMLYEMIKTLKFDKDKLTGVWSIDFVYEDNSFWLIDMARGFRSAYWDLNKLSEETRIKLLRKD